MQEVETDNPELGVDELRSRLDDRERLVSELTSRLEQAAEQLDRLKRTGADRGARLVGAGIPAELVEQQRELTEELQEAVQQWGEMQPGMLLSRIEMQVAEVRDLILERSFDTGAPRSTSHRDDSEQSGEDEAPADTSGLSTYEAFKAGLTVDAEDDEAGEASSESEQAETESAAPPPPVEIPPVDPPSEFNIADADEEQLRIGIEERDSYIGYLTRKLRAAEAANRPVGNWADLEDVPEELAERLKDYEKQLDEQLRMAEVETSLERARLGREAARLEFQQHQIERQMARLGMQEKTNEEPGEEPSDEVEGRRGTGWWRIFRRKDDEDEE